jgi:hypothetical protein
MATKLDFPNPEGVFVSDGAVHFDGFVETDPGVLALVSDAESPEAVAHAVLRAGAQAISIAHTGLDVQFVEQRFDGLTTGLDALLESAVSRISGLGESLLGEEDGALPRILAELKVGIATILEDTFDEDSKSSVIAKIDTVLSGAIERLDKSVRANFDPDVPDSGLARTKTDILEEVRAQTRDLRKDVQSLTESIAVAKARSDVAQLTAIKGFSYEDLLEAALARIAAVHEDLVERTGATTGATGRKKGDLVVNLNAADTCGEGARFVLECKDTKLSMPKTMAELEKALDNRGALAAIAVFSHQSLAPTPLPFMPTGNRAIVVYDKDDPDDAALQLAYAWARFVSRRELTSDADGLDVVRIEAALTRARRALQKHQTVRSCLTAAANKIDEGGRHVADLVDEVRDALGELWDALKDTDQS